MTKIEHLGNIDKGCVVLWQCKVQNGKKSFGVYNFVYETWYLHLLKDRYYQNLNFDKKKQRVFKSRNQNLLYMKRNGAVKKYI